MPYVYARKCNQCRFWSERLAMALDGGPVQAYCLAQGGPYSGQYTYADQGCGAGKPNTYGAVDTPGEMEWIAARYAKEDAARERDMSEQPST